MPNIALLPKTVYNNSNGEPKNQETAPTRYEAWDAEQMSGKTNEIITELNDIEAENIYTDNGVLLDDRIIDGDNNELTFTDLSRLNLEGEEVILDGTNTLVDGTTKLDLSSGTNGSEFTFLMEGGTAGGVTKFLDNKNNKGIEYAANYAANWTNAPSFDNVLATKKYVDDNAVSSNTTGEPTGSDVVLNVVSLTQAEYDAGTPISTTFYLITDA